MTLELYTANPLANYLAYKDEIDDAVLATLRQPCHALGPVVEDFESAFAAFVGVPHAVAVHSGTDAIHLALRAAHVGPGHEVITVSHTSVATVAAIELAKARPALVDVKSRELTIDPVAVSSAITERTRAVVAVHLYGQPADVESLRRICAEHDLVLIEDCAQSMGATSADRHLGTFGAAGCFSFYPTKNLGTVGDGGMVITSDEGLARRLRMLRQYGWNQQRISEIPGVNSRLGVIEAAILRAKLPHLPEMLARRRAIAARYYEAFRALPLTLPTPAKGSEHACHLFVVQCQEHATREGLRRWLDARGVHCSVHYPVPVHLQPSYRERFGVRILPISEHAAATVLSLPLYPELSEADQEHVITNVLGYYHQ